MADPTLFTAHVSQGLGRLLTQFQGQPNFEGQLRSFLNQVQEIENMLYSLIVERYLTTAVGAQLDGIGRVVNQLRLGLDDADYLVALQGRIVANRANSRVEDIYFMFSVLLPGFTFELVEGIEASFTFIINEALTGSDPSLSVLSDQLQLAKGAGIRANLMAGGFPASNRFTFASGSTPVVDADRGFSDVAMTTGGHFIGIA